MNSGQTLSGTIIKDTVVVKIIKQNASTSSCFFSFFKTKINELAKLVGWNYDGRMLPSSWREALWKDRVALRYKLLPKLFNRGPNVDIFNT